MRPPKPTTHVQGTSIVGRVRVNGAVFPKPACPGSTRDVEVCAFRHRGPIADGGDIDHRLADECRRGGETGKNFTSSGESGRMTAYIAKPTRLENYAMERLDKARPEEIGRLEHDADTSAGKI